MSEPWVITKFGGTSVRNRACWENIVAITDQHIQNGKIPVIVCSAPATVSNKLEKLIASAVQYNYSNLLQEIKEIYENLVQELSIGDEEILTEDFNSLQNLCEGIGLLGEVTPRVQAKIMALGELILSKLGKDFLRQQDIEINWQDARKLLVSDNQHHTVNSNYLTATCSDRYDLELDNRLKDLGVKAIITQGFIASNQEGETVLLGRDGSDTSAAYFAAKLNANCCEIWTDIPGMYTANPHVIPEARLLGKLDYAEAQEISSAGAKVLHPNCITPLRSNTIPLVLKCIQQPNRAGTLITQEGDADKGLYIKSIIIRHNVLLISIDTISMWKKAGFLSDVFSIFKEYAVSVDLISTSEGNITISLDPLDKPNTDKTLDILLVELNKIAEAKLIGPCASISLIGKNIRSVLHRINELFEVFASQKVHLLSQASNDLNLTFVVNEDQVNRLAKKLHVMLIELQPNIMHIGKSWLEEYGDVSQIEHVWWHEQREKLLDIAAEYSPVYVYSQGALEEAAHSLKACDQIEHIFYAMKANPNPDILRLFYKLGLNFECVSIHEVNHILDLFPNINPKRILFSPNFAPKDEYNTALNLDISVGVDNIYPLQYWTELFVGRDIFIRIDPGFAEGHHKHVHTGGTESKFGIPMDQLAIAANITTKNNINVVGLHSHCGSGILQEDTWRESAITLANCLEHFPKAKTLDLGGGLGVVENPGQRPLSLGKVNASLKQVKAIFSDFNFWLEPGRYLVAKAGVLLARVTQIKQKNNINFIGIETGMNSLIRPALYGAYHEIVNLTNLHSQKTMLANIVGPICETGDVFGYSRLIEPTAEGDILLIATAGAYGHCMSSSYNMRQPAQEFFTD